MKVFLCFILIVVALFEVKAQKSRRINDLLRKYHIIGDVIKDEAREELTVAFTDVDIYITPPYTMTPDEVHSKPDIIEWEADSKAYYTLIYIAADYPNSMTRHESELLKWLVVNIPGMDVEKGETMVEYLPDPDGYETRTKNRFVYFVYKQKGYQKFAEKKIAKDSLEPRKRFSTYEFAKKYNMPASPEACTFYLSSH